MTYHAVNEEDKIKNFIVEKRITKIIIVGYVDPTVHTHFWIHNAICNALQSVGIGIPIVHVEAVDDRDLSESVLCVFTYDNKNKFHLNVCESAKWHYLMLNHTYDDSYPEFMKHVVEQGRGVIFQIWRGSSTDLRSPSVCWPHSFDAGRSRCTLTWAARSPPRVILDDIKKLSQVPVTEKVVFIGTVWARNIAEISDLAIWCLSNAVPLQIFGKQYEKLHQSILKSNLISVENVTINDDAAENLIRSSRFAPAIQGKTQIPYLPCRAFINASYGKAVITNNWAVKRILPASIYEGDIYRLMDAAVNNVPLNGCDLRSVDEVVAKHTYINRIAELLSLFRRE